MSDDRRRLVIRLVVATFVAAAVTIVTMTTRSYPWYLAAITGVAAAFLTFYVFRAADNLRSLYRE